MNTMTEIVESIKNKKLKAVALVIAMLTVMLTSCGELQGPAQGANAGETEEETYIIKENTLRDRFELYGIFKEMDYSKMYGDMGGYKELQSEISAMKDRVSTNGVSSDTAQADRDALLASFEKILNQDDDKCTIFKLTHPHTDTKEYRYEHTIVIENNSVYVLSNSKEVGYFVTGFIDGEFKNSISMLSATEHRCVETYLANSDENYERAIRNLKHTFLNIILTESTSGKANRYSGSMECGVNWKYNEETKKIDAELKAINMFDKDGNWLYSVEVQSNVDVHELDPYIEGVYNLGYEPEVTVGETTIEDDTTVE